ncbi:MAG TPA: phospholipid carrier-dependent glycosyltransferase, partial [Streptosporangiaceae bacterium]
PGVGTGGPGSRAIARPAALMTDSTSVAAQPLDPARGRIGSLVGLASPARLAALARDNQLFALALGAGAVLRILAMVGYPGVLWFLGDSYLYLGAALRPRPDLSKTVGYSFFLRALEPFHSLILVAVVQHLMGLAIGILVYALLRRSRVARHWAALAATPVLLDGNEIQLEHMVMAETLFTFLVMISMTLLLWRPRPSWPAGLAAGLLTGYAVLVRTEGVPLPLVLAGYLVVRRVGWRPVVAVIAGCAAPIAGYAIWFHSWNGQYALTRSEGFYLWGRVSTFADCAQIRPPADERRFCLSTPPAKRLPAGTIIWETPKIRHMPGGPVSVRNNRLLRDFAIRAILAQPGGYLTAIADEAGIALDWRRYPYPSAGTVSFSYFHLKPQVVPDRSWIPGGTAPRDVRAYGRASPSRVIRPVAYLIGGYQRVFYTWGPLFGAILAVGLAGLIRFRRRLGGAGLLPWAAAVVLLITPIATAGLSYRYLIPVLPLSGLAAGLAAVPRNGGAPRRVAGTSQGSALAAEGSALAAEGSALAPDGLTAAAEYPAAPAQGEAIRLS